MGQGDELESGESDIFVHLMQAWLTPVIKVWPGSARQEEIHGDRNVVATLYEPLSTVKKK